jgi:hypothetical protein
MLMEILSLSNSTKTTANCESELEIKSFTLLVISQSIQIVAAAFFLVGKDEGGFGYLGIKMATSRVSLSLSFFS